MVVPFGRHASWVLLSTLLALVLSGCTGGREGSGSRSAGADASPKLWGYVLNADSSKAVNARVWTEPASVVVAADSQGYWSIDVGLVPGRYEVRAEMDGVQGRVRRVETRLRESHKVIILLGEQETAWPPPATFDRHLPTGSLGPGRVRGTEE
jgi:hypothetical protein